MAKPLSPKVKYFYHARSKAVNGAFPENLGESVLALQIHIASSLLRFLHEPVTPTFWQAMLPIVSGMVLGQTCSVNREIRMRKP